MMILSALRVIHESGVYHLNIGSVDSYWLREDYSLALVGFMGAKFIGRDGVMYPGHTFEPTERRQSLVDEKADLFDWAELVSWLMTAHITVSSATTPADKGLAQIVRKCWMGGYDNAKDVLIDVKKHLRHIGLVVEGDDLVGD